MNDINKTINQSYMYMYTGDHGCENGSLEINNLIIQKLFTHSVKKEIRMPGRGTIPRMS